MKCQGLSKERIKERMQRTREKEEEEEQEQRKKKSLEQHVSRGRKEIFRVGFQV